MTVELLQLHRQQKSDLCSQLCTQTNRFETQSSARGRCGPSGHQNSSSHIYIHVYIYEVRNVGRLLDTTPSINAHTICAPLLLVDTMCPIIAATSSPSEHLLHCSSCTRTRSLTSCTDVQSVNSTCSSRLTFTFKNFMKTQQTHPHTHSLPPPSVHKRCCTKLNCQKREKDTLMVKKTSYVTSGESLRPF